MQSHADEAEEATKSAQYMKRHQPLMDLLDDPETRREGLELITQAMNRRASIYRTMRELKEDILLINELQIKGDPAGLIPERMARAVKLQERVINHCYHVWRAHHKFEEFKVLNEIPEPRDKRYKDEVPESPEPEDESSTI